MRVRSKLVLLIVFAMTGVIFALGKPAKEETMTASAKVEDANKAVQEPQKPAEVEKPAKVEPKKEEKKAEMPAVKPGAEKGTEASPSSSNEAVAGKSSDTAVTVNGEVITEAQVNAKLAPILQRAAVRMDPNSIALYANKIRGQVVEGMIMEKLLDEQAAKAGITVTASDVNDRIGEILAKQGISMDNLGAILKMQGQSMEQFHEQIKKGMTYEKLMDKEVGKVDVNEADALAYYQENKEDFNTPEEVRASHILIKVSPSATPEEKAAAKEKAEKLLKEIKDGADFATLAKEYSDDPGSKMKGGDLGYFGRGRMVKEFEDAAFALQPGQVSGIVETQFGYHIIKVTGRKPAGLTPFADVKDDIIKNLERAKQTQMFRQYVQKLRAEAKVVYPPGKEPEMMMPIGPASQ